MTKKQGFYYLRKGQNGSFRASKKKKEKRNDGEEKADNCDR